MICSAVQNQAQYEVPDAQTSVKLATSYKCPHSPEAECPERFCRFHLVVFCILLSELAEAWKWLYCGGF